MHQYGLSTTASPTASSLRPARMSPATTPASSVRDDEWEALRCAHMQHMLPPAGFRALLCCALAHGGCCVPGAVILLLRSNTTFSRRPTTQRSCAAQIRASWRGWVRARKKRKSFWQRGTFALYDSLSPRQRGVPLLTLSPRHLALVRKAGIKLRGGLQAASAAP